MKSYKNNKSLFFLSAIYAMGNFGSRVLSFLLIFFTTYYLTSSEVGQFDLVLISLNILIPLFSLQISDSIFRWLITVKDRKEGQFIVSTGVFFYFITSIVFILIWKGLDFFSLISFQFSNYIIILIIVQSFYIVLQQIVRGIGYNKLYAINGVINSFINVSLSVYFLVFTNLKIEGLLISIITAYCITSIQLIFVSKIYKLINIKLFDIKLLKEMLSYSCPMIPNSLSWWGISSSNRYLILLFLGTSFNGIFAIAFKLPTIVTMIVGVFTLAWQEKSILTFNDKNRNEYYTSVFDKYSSLLICFSAVVLSLNNFLFHFFIDKSFIESKYLVPILMLSTIFSSLASFYSSGFLGAKKTSSLFISTVLSGLFTIILSFFLIPHIGLYGASIGILTGYIFLLSLRIYQSRDIFRIHVNYQKMCGLLIVFFISFIPTYFDNILIQISVIVFVITISLYFNFNTIKTFKNKFL
ncbi:lipopolysaccharide biosynthesis protein [Sphingobacterium bovisgrunnientis]|uniref:lipopolysaccharide biosynthesis protein n=1 Tax=Sphingobacterium bovisgrunnientis TaxID=1874697 RepID=UPI00135A9F22|nr:polysaccharide biosynthesis C-terminal domain-containing protein [Sphingobacterium bovisgrunnientis]